MIMVCTAGLKKMGTLKYVLYRLYAQASIAPLELATGCAEGLFYMHSRAFAAG